MARVLVVPWSIARMRLGRGMGLSHRHGRMI
jgi:hypothetical protein